MPSGTITPFDDEPTLVSSPTKRQLAAYKRLLQAVLLFHVEEWGPEHLDLWRSLTGSSTVSMAELLAIIRRAGVDLGGSPPARSIAGQHDRSGGVGVCPEQDV